MLVYPASHITVVLHRECYYKIYHIYRVTAEDAITGSVLRI
jgi:hypothetical protein